MKTCPSLRILNRIYLKFDTGFIFVSPCNLLLSRQLALNGAEHGCVAFIASCAFNEVRLNSRRRKMRTENAVLEMRDWRLWKAKCTSPFTLCRLCATSVYAHFLAPQFQRSPFNDRLLPGSDDERLRLHCQPLVLAFPLCWLSVHKRTIH